MGIPRARYVTPTVNPDVNILFVEENSANKVFRSGGTGRMESVPTDVRSWPEFLGDFSCEMENAPIISVKSP